MSKKKPRLEYTPELDGLRGVSILCVMAFHARAPFLQGGFIGVDVFFVLSGFLITTLLVSEHDRFGSISLKRFYFRRALRLAPPLILLLLVFCLLSFAFLSQREATRNYIDSLISLLYLSNWARAFSVHPPDFLGHTWSLSIEEQFYVVWPVLLIVLLRSFSSRDLVVTAAISLALLAWFLRVSLFFEGATPHRLYNGSDTHADPLMIGCALGVAYASGFFGEPRQGGRLSRFLVFLSPLSALSLLIVCIGADWQAPYMFQFGYFLVALFSAVLVLDIMMARGGFLRRVLSARLLVWVGSISYGLYLWHYPIYRAMFSLGFSAVVVISLGSLLTFSAAAMSFYLMERPILRLKKRFARAASEEEVQPGQEGAPRDEA